MLNWPNTRGCMSLKMFHSFNRHQFQSLKLSKPIADMAPAWLVKKFGPVTGVIFKFQGAKSVEFDTVSRGH